LSAIVDDSRAAEIDGALQVWRQGDLALDEKWFVHLADGKDPLTSESAESGAGLKALTVACEGLVIVTQTCDVIRKCRERPFVEVSPLIKVDEDDLPRVARGEIPARAAIPTRPDLVADLDRTMTVEKSVVSEWTRTPGWNSDGEVRRFAEALKRKRGRFAFPDGFVSAVSKLRRRIIGKHGRNSDEGRALAALEEIRVTAAPAWDAPSYEVFFTFIRPESTPEISDAVWSDQVEGWLDLCEPNGPITRIDGTVMTLSQMTAKEYVDSDRLDFDYLST